ncbi:GNAT family N-acetyltransferase [Kitasatospora sp. RB6PN24]|uniref:GNAT family N-acetyltransferase n=1 Tax=Kitasatospora humi TaxID=2893891 RepID=UPI001E5C6760|nr:GNAT family N-acetyltransferase [Kitasatospora humi]MCC9305603.1 GNAT family N-acetyltransferase [Kitasatospora humi]
MRLRDVELRDLDAYLAMRCDPVMMAELGGPLPVEGMAAKLERDVSDVASGRAWIKMIDVAGSTAGTVALWSHQDSPQDSHAGAGTGGALISEIGWMVLPRYQGCGLAKSAVRELLDQAAADRRWGAVHAFPAVTNGPSNGICRATGFRLLGERRVEFAGRLIRSNHWVHPAPTEAD